MSFKAPNGNAESARIEMANPESFSEAQRKVYNRIVSGKRGKVVGPLRVALHSPELADRWQALGEFLRYQTDLPVRITELSIITTGRYWNSQVEWMIHARIAAESGLDRGVIEAIRTAQPPRFHIRLESLVYNFTRETLEFGQVGDELYKELHGLLGTAPLVELTAVIGYYSMVAMTLNIHRVPVPASENAKPLELEGGDTLMHPTRLPKAQAMEGKGIANNG